MDYSGIFGVNRDEFLVFAYFAIFLIGVVAALAFALAPNKPVKRWMFKKIPIMIVCTIIVGAQSFLDRVLPAEWIDPSEEQEIARRTVEIAVYFNSEDELALDLVRAFRQAGFRSFGMDGLAVTASSDSTDQGPSESATVHYGRAIMEESHQSTLDLVARVMETTGVTQVSYVPRPTLPGSLIVFLD